MDSLSEVVGRDNQPIINVTEQTSCYRGGVDVNESGSDCPGVEGLYLLLGGDSLRSGYVGCVGLLHQSSQSAIDAVVFKAGFGG